MNVLSLCNGMSCAEIALIEAGISYDELYYSEIDKFANEQTEHNFPNSIALGDIRTVEVSELEKIGLVMAGTPCTDLSFAGKRTGLICNTLEDYLPIREEWLRTGDESLYVHEGKFQQSILFWEFVRILRDIQKYNPGVKFLLENVRMTKPQERIINEALGLFPVVINSNLVSAQNRYRLYWTNIRTRSEGLFGEIHSDIPQPEDQKIFLEDVLQDEDEIDEKYFLSDALTKNMIIDISLNSNGGIIGHSGSGGQKGEIYSTKGKMGALTATDYKQPKQICVAMRGRNPENPSDRTAGAPTKQRLEPNMDGKTNTLTSVAKDNLILGYRLRRLTPTECARLQTIPDWYEWVVSESQQYKMLGNGWTVKVISHILSYLK